MAGAAEHVGRPDQHRVADARGERLGRPRCDSSFHSGCSISELSSSGENLWRSSARVDAERGGAEDRHARLVQSGMARLLGIWPPIETMTPSGLLAPVDLARTVSRLSSSK